MFGGFGRTWATILRRSDYKVSIESPVPVGAAGVQLPGTGGLEEPVAFPRGQETSRDLRTVEFEIPAGLSSGL